MSQVTEGRSVMVQGRIVWLSGDLFKGRQKTDQNTRAPLINADGSPKIEYGFGLAVPKSALQAGQSAADLWAAIHEETFQIYPSRQVPPQYAWKYKDGDGVDHNGAPFANREGYAGHLVFSLTTSIPIKFFRHENGNVIQIAEGIKCGDYVQVQVQVKAHTAMGQGKPGLYLNPLAVLFIGYGKEIINVPSGDQIFGTQAPALPPGASATPIAPTNSMLVPTGNAPMGYAPPAAGTPSMPMMNTAAPAAYPSNGMPAAAPSPIPGYGAASVPQQPAVQPYYNILPPTHQPQVQQPQGMPAPAPVPQQPMYPQAAPQGVPGVPQFPGTGR